MSSDGSSGALDAAPGHTSGLSSISEYRAHDTSASGFSSETGADDMTLDAAHAAFVSEMGYDNPELEDALAAHGLDRSKTGEGPRPQVVPKGPAAEGSPPSVKVDAPIGPSPPPPAAPLNSSPPAPKEEPVVAKTTKSPYLSRAAVEKAAEGQSSWLKPTTFYDDDSRSIKSRSSCGSGVKARVESMKAGSTLPGGKRQGGSYRRTVLIFVLCSCRYRGATAHVGRTVTCGPWLAASPSTVPWRGFLQACSNHCGRQSPRNAGRSLSRCSGGTFEGRGSGVETSPS